MEQHHLLTALQQMKTFQVVCCVVVPCATRRARVLRSWWQTVKHKWCFDWSVQPNWQACWLVRWLWLPEQHLEQRQDCYQSTQCLGIIRITSDDVTAGWILTSREYQYLRWVWLDCGNACSPLVMKHSLCSWMNQCCCCHIQSTLYSIELAEWCESSLSHVTTHGITTHWSLQLVHMDQATQNRRLLALIVV